jgi:two-component system, OmpR family, sensor kinase
MPSRIQPPSVPLGRTIFARAAARPLRAKRSSLALRAGDYGVRARELVCIASHDLRAPLAAIQLQVATLVRRLDRQIASEEEWRGGLSRIQRAAAHALEMIDDVLTIEHLANIPDEDAPPVVDIEDVIAEAVSLHQDVLRHAGCQVVVSRSDDSGPLRGSWNRACLLRLFSNLVQNVIKYAPSSPILIHLQRGRDRLRIRFADQGPGLPAAPSAHAGASGEPESVSPNGFGLGLWIVRRAVAQMRGSLKIQTARGNGLVFEIDLPT